MYLIFVTTSELYLKIAILYVKIADTEQPDTKQQCNETVSFLFTGFELATLFRRLELLTG